MLIVRGLLAAMATVVALGEPALAGGLPPIAQPEAMGGAPAARERVRVAQAPPAPVSDAPGSVSVGVDAAHSGFYADYDLVPPLALRWTMRDRAAIALAADGRVYLVGDGVSAVAQATGARLWAASVPTGPVHGAAYHAGRVLVTAFEHLHAYDAASGALLWSQSLVPGRAAGAPVAADGVVYITAGDELLALDAADGTRLWRRPALADPGLPAVDRDRVYVGAACGSTGAYARGDGAEAWTHRASCTGQGGGIVAIHGGRVYPSGGGHASDGSWLWPPVLDAGTGALLGRVFGVRPAFVDGLAIFDELGRLRAIEPATGREAWRSSTAGVPLAVGHDVYGIEPDAGGSTLVALDAESGEVLWSEPTPAGPEGARFQRLAVAPGLLIVAGGGVVSAYEPALRPAPDGVVLVPPTLDALAGVPATAVGLLGRNLRAARPEMAIEAAAWHRGGFRRVGALRPARDGGFAVDLRARRNARFRVTAGSATSAATVVYVHPRVRLGRPRRAGRDTIVGAVVHTPGVRLAGLTLALYYRDSRRTMPRLAAGRLRAAGPGRARTTLRLRVPRHVGDGDSLHACVRGAFRRGLGRPSPLTRRCGARRLPAPE